MYYYVLFYILALAASALYLCQKYDKTNIENKDAEKQNDVLHLELNLDMPDSSQNDDKI